MAEKVTAPTWKTWLGLLGICGLFGLGWLPANTSYLRHQAASAALNQHHDRWRARLEAKLGPLLNYPWRWDEAATPPLKPSDRITPALLTRLLQPAPRAHLVCDPAPCGRQLRWSLKKQGLILPARPGDQTTLFLRLRQHQSHSLWLGIDWWPPQRQLALTSDIWLQRGSTIAGTMEAKSTIRLAHWSALLPPLAAIFFALLTHRILMSLFLSLLLGSIILHQDLLAGGAHTFSTYIWKKAIYKEFSVNIILFILALIGMINVCTKNGGVRGLIDRLMRFARTPRSSRFLTALLGLLIFFDDYANTIMVGNTMRPLTDRYKISREKLAYLIDSTAAPIAGLALLSTWIGYEVGLLGDIARQLELSSSGYQIFLSTIPFRFYCWMTLIFVFVGIALDRDFGPMLTAERRAWTEGKLLRDGSTPMIDADTAQLTPSEDIPHRAINVLVPVSAVLLSVLVGLMWVGGAFAGESIFNALKRASFQSSRVFLIAALIGSALAIVLSVAQRLLSWKEAIGTWLTGARGMTMAVGILIFAWALSALSRDLGTAHYLIALLHGQLPPMLLPLLVFAMAAAVAFSTGTSWGAMGILLPTVGPLALAMGGMPIFLLSVGAVLDGSIFGDHCSPLSDTTLFSSAAAACDHLDHVKTQAPYASTVMVVASICGYLAVAMGLSVWLSVLAALLIFVGIFTIVGRPTNPPATHAAEGAPSS